MYYIYTLPIDGLEGAERDTEYALGEFLSNCVHAQFHNTMTE